MMSKMMIVVMSLVPCKVLSTKDIIRQYEIEAICSHKSIEEQLVAYAKECEEIYCVPYELVVSKAWQESHIGKSEVAKKGNNLYGITAGDYWTGDYTKSCDSCAKYRSYKSWKESTQDFCQFVAKYYPSCLGKPANKWKLLGYASSPHTINIPKWILK